MIYGNKVTVFEPCTTLAPFMKKKRMWWATGDCSRLKMTLQQMNTRLFTWNSSINIAGDMAILSDMYFLWLYSAYNKEDYKAKTLLQWVPLASLVQSLSILYAKCYFVGVRLCRVCTHSASIRAFIDTDANGLICAHIDTHRHTHTETAKWCCCGGLYQLLFILFFYLALPLPLSSFSLPPLLLCPPPPCCTTHLHQ